MANAAMTDYSWDQVSLNPQAANASVLANYRSHMAIAMEFERQLEEQVQLTKMKKMQPELMARGQLQGDPNNHQRMIDEYDRLIAVRDSRLRDMERAPSADLLRLETAATNQEELCGLLYGKMGDLVKTSIPLTMLQPLENRRDREMGEWEMQQSTQWEVQGLPHFGYHYVAPYRESMMDQINGAMAQSPHLIPIVMPKKTRLDSFMQLLDGVLRAYNAAIFYRGINSILSSFNQDYRVTIAEVAVDPLGPPEDPDSLSLYQ